MIIPWKLKSAVFRAIDRFGATGLLYWLQANITKRARLHIGAGSANWQIHREHLATLGRPAVFEFGAGKSLQQNIYLSRYFASQTVVDLFPMLDLQLADAAARVIATLPDGSPYQPIAQLADLALYGIEYRAPCDAGSTGLASGSFDACISTNTLEHIPAPDIERICTELRRILRTGGLVSAVIDYSDHYAHTDAGIGRLNYLQFSDAEFKKYNHTVHYQNRLRHGEYLALFKRAGFEVQRSEARKHCAPPATVAARFDATNPDTFATVGVFLLRKS
jgi:SAM-dependent methyltransferase